MFFGPFSIAITSLGEERANLSAFRTFVIVALPGLFSYLFFFSDYLADGEGPDHLRGCAGKYGSSQSANALDTFKHGAAQIIYGQNVPRIVFVLFALYLLIISPLFGALE